MTTFCYRRRLLGFPGPEPGGSL